MAVNFFDIITFIIVFLTEIWLVGDMIVKMIQDNVAIFTITSPLVFPFLLSLVLGICLIMLFVRLFKVFINKSAAQNEVEEEAEEGKVRGIGINKIIFIFIFMLLIYSYLLPVLHFVLATIVFLILGMLLINEDEKKIKNKIVKPVIIAVIAVPIIYYVFYNIFEVVFP